MRSPENYYINNLDRPEEDEIAKRGLLAEELVVNAINTGIDGLEARLSTLSEDSGVKDIGPTQTIDAVAYSEGKPVMGIQITTAEDPKTRQKKMQELMDQPFIRLAEMRPKDPAIPKVLVYLDRKTVDRYEHENKIESDMIIKIIDGAIKSLTFDLAKTQNPQEQKAIRDLIQQLTQEQKKLIH